jgi:pimeloyl-ACP methyl ester carboxylesterase
MSTENGRIPMILIHGAWLSARSWENFADYFGKRGFDVRIPQWPRKHGDVAELRESAEELAGLGLTELIERYEEEIRALDQPPVLMATRTAASSSSSSSTAATGGPASP